MTEEIKNELSTQVEETAVAAHEDPVKKTGLMRGARDFIENTFASLKGKDMNQAVEEFTSEMTIVAEGLSEDQAQLRHDLDALSAQMTLLEDNVSRLDEARKAESKGMGEAVAKLEKRMEKLEKRMEKLEKTLETLEKVGKKPQKAGLHDILKQGTWIVGLFCVSWVIVTLLKLIGG